MAKTSQQKTQSNTWQLVITSGAVFAFGGDKQFMQPLGIDTVPAEIHPKYKQPIAVLERAIKKVLTNIHKNNHNNTVPKISVLVTAPWGTLKAIQTPYTRMTPFAVTHQIVREVLNKQREKIEKDKSSQVVYERAPRVFANDTLVQSFPTRRVKNTLVSAEYGTIQSAVYKLLTTLIATTCHGELTKIEVIEEVLWQDKKENKKNTLVLYAGSRVMTWIMADAKKVPLVGVHHRGVDDVLGEVSKIVSLTGEELFSHIRTILNGHGSDKAEVLWQKIKKPVQKLEVELWMALQAWRTTNNLPTVQNVVIMHEHPFTDDIAFCQDILLAKQACGSDSVHIVHLPHDQSKTSRQEHLQEMIKSMSA